MTAKKPDRATKTKPDSAAQAKPVLEVTIGDPAKSAGKLKSLGGSNSDEWNQILANQVMNGLWVAHSNSETRQNQYSAAAAAMVGMKPSDEIEGMLIAQMLATHNTAMECHRRAMIEGQSFEGRAQNLSQANKLSRTHAALVDTLNKHRGKGQQKMTIEHVHVHDGGKAAFGDFSQGGGGDRPQTQGQPHALGYDASAPMRSANTGRDFLSVASDAERPLQDARRAVAGRSDR